MSVTSLASQTASESHHHHRPVALPVSGLVALVLVYLSWGTTFGAIHIGLQSLPPAVLASQRFVVSGLVLLVLGWVMAPNRFRPIRLWRILYPNAKTVWLNVAIGLLLYGLGNGLTPWPLQHLPTGMAAAIIAFNPFLLIALTWVIPPRETASPAVLGALAVGMVGLGILMWPQLSQSSVLSPAEMGQFMGSLGLFAIIELGWCAGSLIARRQTRDDIEVPHYLLLVSHQNLLVAAVYAVVSAWSGYSGLLLGQGESLAGSISVVYLGLVGTCIGMLCYLYTLKTLPLPLASTFNFVTPLITAIIGVVWLNEPSGTHLWVGLGVILVSVLLVQRATQNRKQPPRWPMPPRPVVPVRSWLNSFGTFRR